ncbi:SEC-C metal-binding domain-containing protein [Clostridioides difficile]|nr:SEC-C metal-binding domain-containing protein [Clostridioides difficile]MDX5608590.1 SEC-C metal-binding domain-containing protein [Clostridioides difficile]
MLGRNELCPCGSGKKYKKCCLNKAIVSERACRNTEL